MVLLLAHHKRSNRFGTGDKGNQTVIEAGDKVSIKMTDDKVNNVTHEMANEIVNELTNDVGNKVGNEVTQDKINKVPIEAVTEVSSKVDSEMSENKTDNMAAAANISKWSSSSSSASGSSSPAKAANPEPANPLSEQYLGIRRKKKLEHDLSLLVDNKANLAGYGATALDALLHGGKPGLSAALAEHPEVVRLVLRAALAAVLQLRAAGAPLERSEAQAQELKELAEVIEDQVLPAAVGGALAGVLQDAKEALASMRWIRGGMIEATVLAFYFAAVRRLEDEIEECDIKIGDSKPTL